MIRHEENVCVPPPQAEAVARLNDQLRQTGVGGMIFITREVVNLPGFDASALTGALARYDAFDAGNDPHGERDFGALELFGANLLWKIDHYDLDQAYASPDPGDTAVTKRDLTVMLADEY